MFPDVLRLARPRQTRAATFRMLWLRTSRPCVKSAYPSRNRVLPSITSRFSHNRPHSAIKEHQSIILICAPIHTQGSYPRASLPRIPRPKIAEPSLPNLVFVAHNEVPPG